MDVLKREIKKIECLVYLFATGPLTSLQMFVPDTFGVPDINIIKISSRIPNIEKCRYPAKDKGTRYIDDSTDVCTGYIWSHSGYIDRKGIRS